MYLSYKSIYCLKVLHSVKYYLKVKYSLPCLYLSKDCLQRIAYYWNAFCEKPDLNSLQ